MFSFNFQLKGNILEVLSCMHSGWNFLEVQRGLLLKANAIYAEVVSTKHIIFKIISSTSYSQNSAFHFSISEAGLKGQKILLVSRICNKIFFGVLSYTKGWKLLMYIVHIRLGTKRTKVSPCVIYTFGIPGVN